MEKNARAATPDTQDRDSDIPRLRERWEGVSLPATYRLEQWMSGDERTAFFQSSPAPDGRRTIAKVIRESAVGSAWPLDLWDRTHQLRHPNLVELFACGRTVHDGESVFYAVFEAPDDTLAAALSRSPLNRQEAREVLDSVLDALRYLHAQGLVLGALDPDRIVAVGDRIKISTDDLREADTASAHRKDIRLLGELWQQSLMAASPRSAEIAPHAADRNPQTRWTLAEICAALDPVDPPVPPLPAALPPPMEAPVPVALPVVEAAMPAANTSSPQSPSHDGPVAEWGAKPASRAREQAVANSIETQLATACLRARLAWGRPGFSSKFRGRNAHPDRQQKTMAGPTGFRRFTELTLPYTFPKWIIVGAVGVLGLILGFNRLGPAGAAEPSQVATVSLPATTTRRAPSPSSDAAAPKLPIPEAAERAPEGGKDRWRVIAFTYRGRDAADRKVQQLNQHHPGLHASVFSPRSRRGFYLVSLGGHMSHEEAVRLQQTARGKGLPRDLYVQNYAE